jgi:outer membrane lipoprotein SlyB
MGVVVGMLWSRCDTLRTMTDERRDEEPTERQIAIGAGSGVAVGVGIGAAIFAGTGDEIWIALGAGLGAAFGAAVGYIIND